WPGRVLTMGTPGREQDVGDFRRDRLLIQTEPDLNRQAALGARIGRSKLRCAVSEPQRPDLMTIGRSREAEATRRRQTGARKLREIGGLGADALRLGRQRTRERNDETVHASNIRPGRGTAAPGPSGNIPRTIGPRTRRITSVRAAFGDSSNHF